MRFIIAVCVLSIASVCQAQSPIFLGTGSYSVPAGAYGPVDTGGWYYSSPVTPRYPVYVAGAGSYAVRDARDLKILQANLKKRGYVPPAPEVPPQPPACANGRCNVGGGVQFILGGQ